MRAGGLRLVLTEFKTAARRAIEPVARILASAGVTANAVTGAGVAISFGAGWLFAVGQMRWAGAALIVAGLCDALDGALARRSGTVTPFGAFLDSTVDRYADGAPLAGIAWWAGMRHDGMLCALALLALVGSFAVSYARARAEGLGQACTVGWMERPERLVLLIAGALGGALVLPWAVGVLAIGANVTAVQRVVHVHRAFRTAENDRGTGGVPH